MNNFQDAVEIIGQAVFELLLPEDPENDEIRKIINNLLNAAEEGYVLVQWPESQNLMEEDWFEEEAILSYTGSSAYFVPIKRVV